MCASLMFLYSAFSSCVEKSLLGVTNSRLMPNKFFKVMLCSSDKNFRFREHVLQKCLVKGRSEFIGCKDLWVYFAAKLGLLRPKGFDGRFKGNIADQHQINVTTCCFGLFGHRAKYKGNIDFCGQAFKTLRQYVRNAGGFFKMPTRQAR